MVRFGQYMVAGWIGADALAGLHRVGASVLARASESGFSASRDYLERHFRISSRLSLTLSRDELFLM